MRWIILALSLGAATMSIMHGILIILGIFNPPEVAAWSAIIPQTVLKSLPIVSAFAALIGGVIAFSGSKIGALFLLIATALCAFAPRDIWIYGVMYFISMILCVFIKKRYDNQDYYDYDFEDFENIERDDDYDDNGYEAYASRNNNFKRGGNYNNNNYANDYEYEDERVNPRGRGRERERQEPQNLNLNLKAEARDGGEEYETRGTPLRSDDLNLNNNINNNINNIKNDDDIEIPESVLPRRRAFKTCPNCGETVSTDASVCPTCNAPLHVPEYAKRDKELDKSHNIINLDIKNLDLDKDKQEIKQEIKSESRDDDMEGVVRLEPTAAHKVFVSPRHEEDDIPRRPVNFENTRRTSIDINPDKSYQEFGQYARSRRKRGRGKSLGRKLLGFLLLFAAVGGSLWFLLGLRKLPKGETPPNAAPIINTRQEREEREEREASNPVEALVQPVGEPAVSVTETANNNISLPAFTPDRNPSRAIITRPGVNLREDHNTVSKSLAKLSANTQAELLERWAGSGTGRTPGPWYKVRTGNREGWVYGDYVQQRGGSLPSGYSSALLKSFGSSKADLNSSFGSPRSQNNTTIDWPGVTATFRNNNLVRLRLNPGSQYELKNGLRPGLSRDELLNIMGYPSSISQRNYVYSENGKTGISVELRNNNVNSVTVNAVP